MKRFLLIVGGVMVVGLGLLLFTRSHSSISSVNKSATTTGTGTTAYHPDPSNATFVIDSETVSLRNGSAESSSADGLTTETDLSDTIGYGDLNHDHKEDAAVIITSTNPVTGFVTFYVGGYVSSLVGYRPTNTITLGTQISPQSVSVTGSTISVSYLDRPQDAPLSEAPSIHRTRTFDYSPIDNSIEEK